jgi:hypothetical protein
VSEPQRLYTANEIGTMLGKTRHWVLHQFNSKDAPPPSYTTFRGTKRDAYLWTAEDLARWRDYHAGIEWRRARTLSESEYSDHKAVNQVGSLTVTWKLWWRCLYDGIIEWWFSTPQGWVYRDDLDSGWREWHGGMMRPTEYHYFCVNRNDKLPSATKAILRSADELRQRMESEANQCVR